MIGWEKRGKGMSVKSLTDPYPSDATQKKICFGASPDDIQDLLLALSSDHSWRAQGPYVLGIQPLLVVYNASKHPMHWAISLAPAKNIFPGQER